MLNRYGTVHLTIPLLGRLMLDRYWHVYEHPVRHSPTAWKWWQPFVIRAVRTNPGLGRTPGVHSFNVWLYTRNRAAVRWVCLSRREPGV